jgi:hypothetical protein
VHVIRLEVVHAILMTDSMTAQEDDKPVCVACLGGGVRVAFAPCGHVAYCDACWGALRAKAAASFSKTCPVCQREGSAIKLFYQFAANSTVPPPCCRELEVVKVPAKPRKNTEDLDLMTFLEHLLFVW